MAEHSEFIETRSVRPSSFTTLPTCDDAAERPLMHCAQCNLEWKVSGLKNLFENSKGESKSKCVKSALFDSHRWQIFFYPNSGQSIAAWNPPLSLPKFPFVPPALSLTTSPLTRTRAVFFHLPLLRTHRR